MQIDQKDENDVKKTKSLSEIKLREEKSNFSFFLL